MRLGSRRTPSLACTTGIWVRAAITRSTRLPGVGSRCMTSTNASPESGASRENRSCAASTPPAEAPTPTIGKSCWAVPGGGSTAVRAGRDVAAAAGRDVLPETRREEFTAARRAVVPATRCAVLPEVRRVAVPTTRCAVVPEVRRAAVPATPRPTPLARRVELRRRLEFVELRVFRRPAMPASHSDLTLNIPRFSSTVE